MATFPSIRIEGGLLGPDTLDQLLLADLQGQKPVDFGLDSRRNLTDEIAAVFTDARAYWSAFQNRLERLKPDDIATTVTRDAWAVPFMGLLGYEPQRNPRAYEVDGFTFAISHRASEAEDAPPIHVVGARQELGRVPVSGRPRMAPHSLLQEYLNRTEHLWGIVTNGQTLRLLRDCTFVRRQAYVEFDLSAMFEEQRFQDFVAFYRLLHCTRLPRGMDDTGDCLLEKYYAHSVEQGGRVRDHLRDGVEDCITLLANGFLRHPANDGLRRRVRATNGAADGSEKKITPVELYRQILRLVYRFLFLLVSEDRGLISPDPIYREHYGIARLRRLTDQRAAFTDHDDLWQSLRVLWLVFTKANFADMLRVAPLNGELFNPQDLDIFSITNRDLLTAFWHLTWYQDKKGSPPRRVNYAALDVEELGSVYESLLEFHPSVDFGASSLPTFDLIFGSERKTTGSYYTPPQLVGELIKSALEPVMEDRLKEAKTQKDKERAILSMKVCDPACGSGHFLLAAARRLGKQLAAIRTGEDEPAPERVREAIRDVISHCIYGVDLNTLAVDLCRVALWLESHTGDKPLTFLDHRIRCGNSLVGVFDLSTLEEGIPDKVFEALEGDDKAVARELKKRNASERAGQDDLFLYNPDGALSEFTGHSHDVDAIADDSPEDIRRKKTLYEQSRTDLNWMRQKQACDLWTAAFFQPLNKQSPAITTSALREHLAGRKVDTRVLALAESLSMRRRFFHWPLEFPEVFSSENHGFDIVLGNPPWERLQFEEKTFFAGRSNEIWSENNQSKRRRMIASLRDTNPPLFADWLDAAHAIESQAHFLRTSQRFPLSAVDKFNLYALFAELFLCLTDQNGRCGLIVKGGYLTDKLCSLLFSTTMKSGRLISGHDFENRKPLFLGVDSRERFVLLTLGADAKKAVFSFDNHEVDDIRKPNHPIEMRYEDILILSPTFQTCPKFANTNEFKITIRCYSSIPVFGDPKRNPWLVSIDRYINVSDISSELRSAENLTEKERTAFNSKFMPLMEGKLFHQFDHRFASYSQFGLGPTVELTDKHPSATSMTATFVPREIALRRNPSLAHSNALLVVRDITNRTNERGVIAAIIPPRITDYTIRVIRLKASLHEYCWVLSNLNSFVLDFLARQKLGGTHLSNYILVQLPIIPRDRYTPELIAFIKPRVLELVYTAHDLEPFARDMGFNDPPFVWDEERRFQLRCELDALYFHLYGLTRDETDYVMDTFPIVKRRDIEKHDSYRTKERILEEYDKLAGSGLIQVAMTQAEKQYEEVKVGAPIVPLSIHHQIALEQARTSQRAERELVDEFILLMHPSLSEKFLDSNSKSNFQKYVAAIKNKHPGLVPTDGVKIRWATLISRLEDEHAISISVRNNQRYIGPGPAFSTVFAGVSMEVAAVLPLVRTAAAVLRKELARSSINKQYVSAIQQYRQILQGEEVANA